jgi:hypothetical protein
MSADAPAPVATASSPPIADPQDPLPESNWVWRRVFVFLFGGLAIGGVALVLLMIWGIGEETLKIVARLGGIRDVRALDSALDVVAESIKSLASLGFWLIILVMVDRILYLIAPSAEQAAKMMATVSAWKAGISTTSTARATAPDGSTAEATKTAGPAAAPPAPPPVAKWAQYAG